MTYKIETLAKELNINLSTENIEGMNALLNRLEGNLSWPDWDESESLLKPPDSDDMATGNDETYGQSITEALNKARLASAGGAYTHIDIAGVKTAVANRQDGPLAGTPIAVKDLMAIAGRPIGAGSAVRAEAPESSRTAPVVAALSQAGAIVIGTTTLHEFAFGVTGINHHTGYPANPHDATRVPGGSSSGSAVAVAEGSARIAIGTDTGGSVRIPAALCGVVGFKPAFGTYPIEGVFPLAPTLDHVGFFAQSVADICLAHTVFEPIDLGQIRPLKVGLIGTQLAQSTPAVQARFEQVRHKLQAENCEIVDVTGHWADSEEVFAASTTIMFSEAAAIHKKSLSHNAESYGEDVRNRLLQGLAISGSDYVMALKLRQRILEQVTTTLARVDCLIGPTVGIVAPKIEAARTPEIAGQLVAFTRLGNVVGLPAISVPIPGDGLPVGLQIMAPNNESTLKIARYLEGLLAAE